MVSFFPAMGALWIAADKIERHGLVWLVGCRLKIHRLFPFALAAGGRCSGEGRIHGKIRDPDCLLSNERLSNEAREKRWSSL